MTAAAGTSLPPGPIVLDASFLIALLEGEEAAQRFAPTLARGIVPSVIAGEAFYKLHTAAGIEPDQIEDGLRALGVALVDLPLAAARHFPSLKSIDAARRTEQKAARDKSIQMLSLGDLCALGYAVAHDLPVLTADRHWATLRPHGLTVEVFNFRDPA